MHDPESTPANKPPSPGLMARADKNRRQALNSVFGGRLRKIEAQLCKPGALPARGIHSILVCRTNHRLGNTVLLSPLLRELEAMYPGAEIDILASGGAAQILYSTRFQTHRIVSLARRMPRHPIQTLRLLRTVTGESYDLAIDASLDSIMGRLILGRCRATHKLGFPLETQVDTDMAVYRDTCPVHFALRNVHLLRTAAGRAATPEWARQNLNLSPAELARGQQALQALLGADAPSTDDANKPLVLGVFANATADKRYPGNWWGDFMQTLRERHPDVRVIDVLADHGRSQLPGDSHPFYSRDLRKLGSVLANLDGFISADCGVMHLASAVGVPTLGLFSRDNLDKYEPYGGRNAAISTRGGLSAPDAAAQAAAWLDRLRPAQAGITESATEREA